MILTYYGKQFFKMQFGDIVVAVNPVGKDSKFEGGRFGADIGLISANHPDYSGADAIVYGDKKPVIISGPGEYEVKGIFIKGFPVETEIKGGKLINTIYTLSLDNISICFLGASGNKQIPAEIKEAIDGVDMIFVPAGLPLLPPREAYGLAVTFGPKVIVPMDYDAATLKTFLKEGGAEGAEEFDKYTVKKKDIETKEGEIVVLKPQNS